jgi:hypothetical protein
VARRFLPAAFLALAAAAAVAGGAPSAPQRPPVRLEVLGRASPGGGYSGDVVGERHYAYLSSHKGRSDCPAQGVRVYDLSNPRRPHRISSFADGGSTPALRDTWTEKTIVRHVRTSTFTGVLAVTSAQACPAGLFGGFALYDVTRPAHPRRLALVRTDPRGSHEIWLAAARGRVWVYTALANAEFAFTPQQYGFHIFDVSDPRKPHEVGGWSACGDLRLCSDPDRTPTYLVHSVITNAAATRAYLSYWDLGTVILDISSPARPRYLGRTKPPQGNAHSAWLGDHGRVLVETHEMAEGRPMIYDVRNPAAPKRLAVVRLTKAQLAGGARGSGLGEVSGIELTDSVHDPKVAGKLAFFSWYAQGVVVFDISSPRHPRFVTRLLPARGRDAHGLLCPGSRCRAVWGVFPTANYVLASDIVTGLWVLRLRGYST